MTQKQRRGHVSQWARCVLPALRRPIGCTITILSIWDSPQLSAIGTAKSSGPFTHLTHCSWAAHLPSPLPVFWEPRKLFKKRPKELSQRTSAVFIVADGFWSWPKDKPVVDFINLSHCQAVLPTSVQSNFSLPLFYQLSGLVPYNRHLLQLSDLCCPIQNMLIFGWSDLYNSQE